MKSMKDMKDMKDMKGCGCLEGSLCRIKRQAAPFP
jgi:hypothetical protein